MYRMTQQEVEFNLRNILSNRIPDLEISQMSRAAYAFQEIELAHRDLSLEPFLDKFHLLKEITHIDRDDMMGYFKATPAEAQLTQYDVAHPLTINISNQYIRDERVILHETLHLMSTTGYEQDGHYHVERCGLINRNLDEAYTESLSRQCMEVLGEPVKGRNATIPCENKAVENISFENCGCGYDIMLGSFNSIQTEFKEDLFVSKFYGTNSFNSHVEQYRSTNATLMDDSIGGLYHDVSSGKIREGTIAGAACLVPFIAAEKYTSEEMDVKDYIKMSGNMIRGLPLMNLKNFDNSVSLSEFSTGVADIVVAVNSKEFKGLGITVKDIYPEHRSDVALGYLATMDTLRSEMSFGKEIDPEKVTFKVRTDSDSKKSVQIFIDGDEMLSTLKLNERTGAFIVVDSVSPIQKETFDGPEHKFVGEKAKMFAGLLQGKENLKDVDFIKIASFDSVSNASSRHYSLTQSNDWKAIDAIINKDASENNISTALSKVSIKNLKDCNNNNIVHLLASTSLSDAAIMERLVIMHGVDSKSMLNLLKESNDLGANPMDVLIVNSNFRAANFVKDHMDENAKTNFDLNSLIAGDTLLIRAIQKNDVQAVKLYSNLGASFDVFDSSGAHPVLTIYESNKPNYEMLNYVSSFNKLIANQNGDNIAAIAVQHSDRTLIEFAKARGVDFDSKNNQGLSASDYADRLQSKDILDMIHLKAEKESIYVKGVELNNEKGLEL